MNKYLDGSSNAPSDAKQEAVWRALLQPFEPFVLAFSPYGSEPALTAAINRLRQLLCNSRVQAVDDDLGTYRHVLQELLALQDLPIQQVQTAWEKDLTRSKPAIQMLSSLVSHLKNKRGCFENMRPLEDSPCRPTAEDIEKKHIFSTLKTAEHFRRKKDFVEKSTGFIVCLQP